MELFSISRHGAPESNSDETTKLNAVLKRIETNKRIAKKRGHESIDDSKIVLSGKELEKTNKAAPREHDNHDAAPPAKKKEKAASETTGFMVLGKTTTDVKQQVKRVLPKWLTTPVVISSELENLNTEPSEMKVLDKWLRKLLKANGVKYFFPVQKTVIPWILRTHKHIDVLPPRDVCVSSPTGSGKTLSFVLPVVQILKTHSIKKIRALVILPTQDLANQVYLTFKKYTQNTHLGVALINGKFAFVQEQKQLVAENEGFGFLSKVDIVVCTAGRLVDHLKLTKGFDLQDLEFLIIDEADRVLNSMQNDWLYHLEKHINKHDYTTQAFKVLNVQSLGNSKVIRKLLFSATLSQDPEKLEKLSTFQPKLFTSVVPENEVYNGARDESTFIGKYTTPKELTEKYIVSSEALKPLTLYSFIKNNNVKHTLVFTHSLESVHRLSLLLKELSGNEMRVAEISSQLPSNSRDDLISKFSKNEIDILICTDALARGMDIPKVKCVISYTTPKFIKTYIHRVGRTARAGEHGTAVTIVQQNQVNNFKNMLTSANKLNIEQVVISEEDLEPLGDMYKEALHKLKKQIEGESIQNLKKIKSVKSKFKKRNKIKKRI